MAVNYVFLGVGVRLERAYFSLHLSQLGIGSEYVVAERVYLLLVDDALFDEGVYYLLLELGSYLVLFRQI